MEAIGRKIRDSRWIRGGIPGQDSLQSRCWIPNLLWMCPSKPARFPGFPHPGLRGSAPGAGAGLYPAHPGAELLPPPREAWTWLRSRGVRLGSVIPHFPTPAVPAFWGMLLHAGSAGSFPGLRESWKGSPGIQLPALRGQSHIPRSCRSRRGRCPAAP